MSEIIFNAKAETGAPHGWFAWVLFVVTVAILCALATTIFPSLNGHENPFEVASNERLSALGECEKGVLAEKARYGTPIINRMVRHAESDCESVAEQLAERERRKRVADEQLLALEPDEPTTESK